MQTSSLMIFQVGLELFCNQRFYVTNCVTTPCIEKDTEKPVATLIPLFTCQPTSHFCTFVISFSHLSS